MRLDMTTKTFSVLFFLYLLLPGLQIAAPPTVIPDSIRTYHLQDSIVVVANRYELPLKSITNSVDIIKRSEYAGLATHSILQLVDIASPEAFVVDKNVIGYGVGSFAGGSINLRGLGGKPNTGVLVLINGRPDFMGIFGHPLPDVYGLANNDKIEVIKGPSSTVFGSNAMGGAVNIITSSPVQNRINLKTQGGSYNTFNQYIGSGYVAGKTSFSINAKHQKTSGHIDSTAFEIYTLGAKLSQQLRNTWQINLEGRYVPYTFDDPQMGPDVANLGTYAKIRRGMADIEISGSAGKLKNSFHLYSNLGHHRFNDGFESHDFSYGLSSYQRYAYSNQIQFSAGLDVLRYGGRAKNVVNPQAPPKSDLHTVNSIGGYILGFYSPLTILNFQGGIRYQYVSLDINKITPTFGVSVYPLSYLKIYASYNQGFRVPTLQELYLFPVSNKNLKPENVMSYESGISAYFLGKNSLDFSVFRNNVENIIQQVSNPNAPPPVIFQNSGKANQWGLESALSLYPCQYLSARLSYSYLEPDELTAFNPQTMIKYLLSIKTSRFEISFNGKNILDLYAGNNHTNKLKNYQLSNLMLAYDFQNWLLDIQLLNLFDAKYEILPGYPGPGFHVLAGISWNWSGD